MIFVSVTLYSDYYDNHSVSATGKGEVKNNYIYLVIKHVLHNIPFIRIGIKIFLKLLKKKNITRPSFEKVLFGTFSRSMSSAHAEKHISESC